MNMCSSYDPNIYDTLSRWQFDRVKDTLDTQTPTAYAPLHPQNQSLTPGNLTPGQPTPVERSSKPSERPDTTDTHTERRYSSIVNGLPTFDDNWPWEADHARPCPAIDTESIQHDQLPPRTSPSATASASSIVSSPRNLRVLCVMGYRTIFGRGYDERSEFWVQWKGCSASEGTWMEESLVRDIAPLQVRDFNSQRRLSFHRGVYGEIFTRKSAPRCNGSQTNLCDGC
ncbi:hypothetical protein ACLX1H_000522 [Fusarium chlamydosporum]